MTQYDVRYRVGDVVATRSLSLAEPTAEAAVRELIRRGLVGTEQSVEILEIEERFGLC